MTVQANQGFGVSVFTTGSGSGGGSTTPGGGTSTVQYNNAGSFAGAAGITTDGTSLTVSGSTAGNLVRITQTGAGNSFVVEDSANPDASPFVIDTNGTVIVGATARFTTATTAGAAVYVVGGSQIISRFVNDGNPQRLELLKSRSTTLGSPSVTVNNADTLGEVNFQGADGTNFVSAAAIAANVDGAPGTNDMPGRLVFLTTADGASTPTERMRIDNQGRLGIGSTTAAGIRVLVGGSLTGAAVSQGYVLSSVVQPDATSIAVGFVASISTASAAFTNSSLQHYRSSQAAFGAGSIVTEQRSFTSESTNVGATNNYGFYGSIAAPTAGVQTSATVASVSQTGTTVTITTSAAHGYTNGQTVTVSLTANAADLVSGAPCTILTLGNTDFTTIGASSNTVGTSFTATGPAVGTTGTVTINSQNSGRTVAGSSGSTFTYTSALSATFTTITATGTVTVSQRYNFYAAGTALNYFAGNVGIGTSAPSVKLDVLGDVNIGAALNTGSGVSTGAASIELGALRTGSGTAFIDFHAEAATDNEARIIRSGGVDGNFLIQNNGTGQIAIRAINAGIITLDTNNLERMRIDNAGRVGVGGTPSSNIRFLLGGGQTLGANPQMLLNQQTILSDATGTTSYYDTFANLQAASFNSSLVTHYRATQGALSGGATITNQRGFVAESSLTGASSNQGFFGNIAAGTNRWNFYAAGSADNYFAGNVGVGIAVPTAKLDIQSTTSGVRFPNMTTTQKNAISGPQAGTIVFDTTLSKLAVYSGTAWETITSI
jgi:hypothetical protein